MVRRDLTASTRVTGSFEGTGLKITDPCNVAQWGYDDRSAFFLCCTGIRGLCQGVHVCSTNGKRRGLPPCYFGGSIVVLFPSPRFRNSGCELAADVDDVVTIGGRVLVAPGQSKADAQIDLLHRL